MNKTFTLAAGLFWLNIVGAAAQDFTFSQYQAVPFLINPAETGGIQGQSTQRISGIFRSQWDVPASDGGIFGSALGWDRRFCDRRTAGTYWSIGAFAQHSGTNGGGIYNLHFRGMASLRIALAKKVAMAIGLSAGGLNYGIDQQKLLFNQQYDPKTGNFTGTDSGENFPRENNLVFDMDAGLRVFGEIGSSANNQPERWWSAGLTFHHLNAPRYTFLAPGMDEEFNRLGIGISVQARARPWAPVQVDALFRRQSISYEGSLQWQAVLGAGFVVGKPERELTIGVNGRFSGQENRLGSFGRWTGMPYTRIRWNDWMVGMTIDLNFSALSSNPPGSFELFAACNFGEKKCPTPCW